MTGQFQHTPGLARGYATAVISSVVLSTTGVFISYLTRNYDLPALVLAFWRDIFAGLTLLIGLSIFSPKFLRINKSQFLYLVFFGFMLSLFNAFWTLSVAYNGASVATVLVYSSTAFTALLGLWLFRDKLDAVRIAGIVICLGGCVLVADAYNPQAWENNLSGIITGLLAGLTYALYTMFGKKAVQRGINPWTTLLYIFWFAGIVLLIVNLLSGGLLPGSAKNISAIVPHMNISGWGILFALAAGPTVLGFVLYNMSLVYLSPNLTNLILTSEPAFTAIIAFFLLGEKLGGLQIAGTVLILGMVLILRFHEGRKEKMINQNQD